ncbi:MAG: Alpha-N-arabinofuranosidase, partial [Acidobacteria bacterium]|nr:Alpha-N-arabinofuranosidase [Acidobacteriota bacterium]
MRSCRLWILTSMLLTVLAGTAAAQPVAVAIDAAKVASPISRWVFGGFMEPATTFVWAEMLADRKFFAEVSSKPPAVQTGGFGRRGPQRRWVPVGPDTFVTMERKDPYVGEWSPLVRLEASTSHGIDQAGLMLKGGRAYAGRVILAGSPGARVTVSLVWGPNPADRQTIAVPGLTATYVKVPLAFTAKA